MTSRPTTHSPLVSPPAQPSRLLSLALVLALILAACVSAPPPTPLPSLSPSPAPSPAPTLAPSPSAPLEPSASPARPSASPPPASPSPSSTPSSSPPSSSTPSPSATPGPATSPGPPDPTAAGRLRQALEAERNLRGIPGMAAVVIFPDGSRWTGATGDADLDPRRPAEPDSRFVVGSITKTFVTATILQLAEEGLVELDGPLARWLPDYPEAPGITLRQLLNHTAGVFNYFEHPRYTNAVFGAPNHLWTPEEVLERFRRPAYFEPGQGYHYSNTGFILLGLVIEAATGTTLGEQLRQRFFEPLGMDDTWFQGDGPPPGDTADGHLRGANGLREISDGSDYRPTRSAASVAWAAGGIVSTADDMATWARALYEGELLAPASLAQMLDFTASPYTAGTYGLGTRTRLFEGVRAVGHTGSLRGFMAAMWHFPSEDVTITVLTNLGRIDANRIADRLAGIALTDAP